MLVHAAWPCLDRKEYWAVTTKTAASGKKPRMHKANNSSIFWSLGCPFRYVDKTFVYLLFVVNQTETGPVVLYFRRDNEISACGLSSVMLIVRHKAGPLCSDWSCIRVHCVHILGPVSTADSGLAPHSPPWWLSMSYFWHSQFLSKPFVSELPLPPY